MALPALSEGLSLTDSFKQAQGIELFSSVFYHAQRSSNKTEDPEEKWAVKSILHCFRLLNRSGLGIIMVWLNCFKAI